MTRLTTSPSLASPLILMTALALSCAHNSGSSSTTLNSEAPARAKPQLVSTATPAPTTTAESQGQQDLNAALARLSEVDVFFGFNEDTLTADAKAKLSSVGDVLTKYPALKIKIDGNADERGTEEYNLVLAQKRADAAKRYLVGLGVTAEQVTTVSYGKERPRDPGHNEKAWQENRCGVRARDRGRRTSRPWHLPGRWYVSARQPAGTPHGRTPHARRNPRRPP